MDFELTAEQPTAAPLAVVAVLEILRETARAFSERRDPVWRGR